MKRLVWGSLLTIGYTYVGFPLLLLLRARLRPRPFDVRPAQPWVSVIIAAHNEEAAIGGKLASVLASEYPAELLEVVVASDGSTDRTASVAAAADGVRVLDLPRLGKAAALNAAIGASSGEVLVFTDANSILQPDAIPELVRPFGDPSVGGVAGDQRYAATPGAADDSAGERQYWDLDRMLKVAESEAGNVISATGALYAIRRELVDEVPDGVTDDFAVSTGVIARGRRLVFARHAIAFEPPAASAADEWGRKVRVITRGLRSVILRRDLLDPRRHGFYALQLASHKILRRLMFVPLAILAVAAPLSWRHGWSYRLLTLGQLGAYGAGAAGLALSAAGRPVHRAFGMPAFFIMANAASAVAVMNVVTGRRFDRWDPQRATERANPPAPPRADDRAALHRLGVALHRLLPDGVQPPSASIVVPVNARADVDNVLRLLDDLSRYAGSHRFDVLLVLNNYDEGHEPPAAHALRELGASVLAIPHIPRPAGQVVPLSARIPGMAAAQTDWTILFDADCRVPHPTELLDWYVSRWAEGDGCAYTRVDYTDLRPGLSIRARVWAHHASRWAKRILLRIPTTRGSNYAVDRRLFARLHGEGLIADELNVGPAVRAAGARVSYSGDRVLTVLTSGRMFRGGWMKLVRYLRYRLAYNLRVLPVRPGAAERTGREHDPVDRFDYDVVRESREP